MQEQQVKTLHQATLCDLIPFTKTDRRVCLQFLKSQVAICKNEIKCKCLCTCTFLHCYSFTFCICNMFYTVRYGKLLMKRSTNAPVVYFFLSFICTYMFRWSFDHIRLFDIKEYNELQYVYPSKIQFLKCAIQF